VNPTLAQTEKKNSPSNDEYKSDKHRQTQYSVQEHSIYFLISSKDNSEAAIISITKGERSPSMHLRSGNWTGDDQKSLFNVHRVRVGERSQPVALPRGYGLP